MKPYNEEQSKKEQVEEMYSMEVEALNAAFVKYYEALMAKMQLMDNLTPEQQE